MAELSRPEAIRAMMSADSIAIVGASENATKPGYRPVSYLKRFGYTGRLYPVNPRLDTCQGLPCYPNLSCLPEAPDLVGVVVAAARVPEVLREAARLGTRSAVVISAGFAEAGPEGVRLQEEITEIAREHGMLVCGPNSVGVIRSQRGLALTFTEALTRGGLAEGPVAMVSQSGAFGTVLYAQARERGLGVSAYVSSGNEACVSFGDYVEALIEEPDISVVGGYVEGLREFESLKRAADTGRRLGKPIVVLKVGRSEPAGQAAASHTGSLVGDDNAYRAAFRQQGILQVEDEQELLDVLDALQSLRNAPTGNKVAVVTISGGAGVLLTDLVEANGLRLASISPDLKNRLGDLLPEFASVENPIDVTGRFVTDPSGLDEVLGAVAEDPGVDLVIAYVGLAWSHSEQWATTLERADNAGAPLVVAAPLLDAVLRKALRARGVSVCTSTRQTVAVCSALVQWGTWKKSEPRPDTGLNGGPVPSELLLSGTIEEDRAKTFLAAAGLPVPKALVTASAAEAETFARRLNRPVALKAHVKGLTHKTDVGGVILNVSPEDVHREYERLQTSFAKRAPHLQVSGIRVEEMITGGVEMVIGAVRSVPFGTLIAVGAGGTDVELKRDLAYGVAPLSLNEAHDMISSLAMIPLLQGYRNIPTADVEMLVVTLVQVSELVAALGERLVEMDLNPVLVRPQGQGVVVLDAILVLDPPGPPVGLVPAIPRNHATRLSGAAS